MDEQKITVKELLIRTVDELKAICVPVQYANDIARPIWNAVNNIQSCIDAVQEEPEVDENVCSEP